MKEKFKTFLLILLVFTSIFLTQKLWIELPNRVFSESEKDTKGPSSSYLLIDMIAPNKYLVNFDEEKHTLFYDDSKYNLWDSASESLANILESKTVELEEIPKEESARYNRRRSIAFEFPEQINTYILARALNVESPNIITDAIDHVDRIYIYLGSKEPFFVFSNKDSSMQVHDKNIRLEMEEEAKLKEQEKNIIDHIFDSNSDIDKEDETDYYKIRKLKNLLTEIQEEMLTKGEKVDFQDIKGKDRKYNFYYSMRDTFGTERDIFIPYKMNSVMPKISVENQIRVMDEDEKAQLAERFFNANIDYIREVVESNGSNIFIHDQRVLKLNSNGFLEYYNALNDDIKKRNLFESMNTAANFLSEISGVPEGLYLSDIENIEDTGSLGYRLIFKYRIRGIPVLLGREDVDFVEMEVYNHHIKSYKQFMRTDTNKPLKLDDDEKKLKMLDSFSVIDMNDDIFLEEYIQMMEEKGVMVGMDDIDGSDVLSVIDDITLAYYDPSIKDANEELIPIWAVKTERALYGFDVFKGKRIHMRKLY